MSFVCSRDLAVTCGFGSAAQSFFCEILFGQNAEPSKRAACLPACWKLLQDGLPEAVANLLRLLRAFSHGLQLLSTMLLAGPVWQHVLFSVSLVHWRSDIADEY